MGISDSRPASPVVKGDTNGGFSSTMPTPTKSSSSSLSSPTSVKRRDLSKRRGSHMFFYDASKGGSVAIFTDANTLTKKFQTRKIPAISSSSSSTSQLVTTEVDVGRPTVRQTPWSVYDNTSDEDDGGETSCAAYPPPPPYEVTLGRTRTSSYDVDCFENSTLANDENFNYTCHDRCQSLLVTKSVKFEHEPIDGSCLVLAEQPRGIELRQMIAKYNMAAAKGYEMELREGDCDTFHGFIRVSMNLSRPINVLAGSRPPSIYDIMQQDGTDQADRSTLTSFYLPRDTVKALHVTSETSTEELVVTLLRKFKVADSPRKYCLYEKYCDDVDGSSARGVLRRLQSCERPLWLVLCWRQEDSANRRLVLQENDTGDILWEEFTVPELSNFLRILDREEEEYLNLVRLKYKKIESMLRKAMDEFEPYETTNDCDGDNRSVDEGVIL